MKMLNDCEFQNDLTQKIATFLNEIGVKVVLCKLDEPTFLPGVAVKDGHLLADEEKLSFPGDLLHEAGHLAVAPASLRACMSDEVDIPDLQPDVLEVEAIAWSYAACVHLGIDPSVVFHSQGYGGSSESLLFNFKLGIFLGVNQLEDSGLAYSPRKAGELGVEPYPKMVKWLKD